MPVHDESSSAEYRSVKSLWMWLVSDLFRFFCFIFILLFLSTPPLSCHREEVDNLEGEGGFECDIDSTSFPLFEESLCISALLEKGEGKTEEEFLDYQCNIIKEGGFSLIRTDFRWVEIEPVDDLFDFSAYDRVEETVNSYGLSILPILGYGNPWATNETDDDPAYPPDDPALFGDFAEEVASHFSGRINHFEIWNEENVGWRFWKDEEDPDAYGSLLKAAFEGVKRGNPEAKVLLGGLFYPDLFVTGAIPFLEGLYEAHPDIGEYYDILAFHPYRYPFTSPETEDETQESLVSSISSIKDLLDRNNDTEKPLWITEMGWHTAESQPLYPGVTEEEQASFTIRAFNLSIGCGVEKFCIYTLFDRENSDIYQEDAFGLFRYDEEPYDDIRSPPKVSYLAILTMKDALSGMRMKSPLLIGEGFDDGDYGFLWSSDDGRRRVSVLWATSSSKTVEIQVSPSANGVELWSMTGDRAGLHVKDGRVEVYISSSPCYLVEYL